DGALEGPNGSWLRLGQARDGAARRSCQPQNRCGGRFAPVRMTSVARMARSRSVAGINGSRIGEPCEPGAEGGATARERSDGAVSSTGARPGGFASVRLDAEAVDVAEEPAVGVSRKAPSIPEGFVPTPTIRPASSIPLASFKNHPEFLGIS